MISRYSLSRSVRPVMLMGGVVLAVACARDQRPMQDSVRAADSSASAQIDSATTGGDTVRGTDTTSTTIAVDSGPTGQILTPWDTELDSANAARSWFVLRERQSIMELIPTRATIATTARPCADTGQGVKPTGVNGEWIAMFADVAGLRAGAVQAATLPPREIGVQQDSVAFTFRDETFVVRTDTQPLHGFRLFHLGKSGRLALKSIDDDEVGRWRVLWAGDLNRDGAPDLLVESADADNVKYVRLYMSGPTPPDSLWRPSAAQAHQGC